MTLRSAIEFVAETISLSLVVCSLAMIAVIFLLATGNMP